MGDANDRSAGRMSVERELLICCPECSVMPPTGVLFTPGQQRGAFREPVVLRGRRCGKYFVQQVLGCHHGPWRGETPAPEVEAKTLANAWNEWAEQAARAKADRLGLSVNRRALWFYYLGATSERPFVENV